MNNLIKLTFTLCIAIILNFSINFTWARDVYKDGYGDYEELEKKHMERFEQRYKNLETEKSIEAKMPYIIHHVWLTHPDFPREIQDIDIENLIATKNVFDQAPVKWEQIVWCNDPGVIPESVAKLEEAGIQVKSIYEEQESLGLFKLIEELISAKLWGKASDALRIALLEHFGGVYADLNYIFNREVTEEVHKYNFFATVYNFAETDSSDIMGNFFFGSSPGHPILVKALELTERSLADIPSIEGVSEFYLTLFSTTFILDTAYYLKANQNGNKDVIYPSTWYYWRKKVGQSESSEEEAVDKVYERDICGSEAYFIGYDSEKGRTWLGGK